MKKALSVIAVVFFLFLIWGTAAFLSFSKTTKGPLISDYPNPKTALLVIDIQKDMTEKNGVRPLNLQQTDSMIPVVNELVKSAEKKGWHVIYVTHEYRKNSILRLVTRNFLLEGLPGAKMDPRILVVNDNHFIKNRMDAFTNLKFGDFLRRNQVNHLILTGMAAEACIDRTCKAALNRGYKVTVISDAIAASSGNSRIRKIEDYKRSGAKIVAARDLK